MHGSIPENAASASHLQHLDLRDNALSGTLPPELGALRRQGRHTPPLLPSTSAVFITETTQTYPTKSNYVELESGGVCGSVTRLRHLDLSGNRLSGPAGGLLRTSTRPTLNRRLLLRASV